MLLLLCVLRNSVSFIFRSCIYSNNLDAMVKASGVGKALFKLESDNFTLKRLYEPFRMNNLC